MKENGTIINPEKVSLEANPGYNDTLTILEGPYEGLKFRYDAVWFDEENHPELGLQFHYKLLNGVIDNPEDREDFEHAIAHLLHAHMKKTQAENGIIVFKGGQDPSPEEFMEHLEGAQPKNLAQQIMQDPGVFLGREKETATNFLDRLAAQGQAAMGNINK
jgi:hypothetical protein